MANMSYCRMHNTLGDLRDAYEHMRCRLENRGYDSEFDKRTRLIELCIKIAEEFGEKDSDGVLTGNVVDMREYEDEEEVE